MSSVDVGRLGASGSYPACFFYWSLVSRDGERIVQDTFLIGQDCGVGFWKFQSTFGAPDSVSVDLFSIVLFFEMLRHFCFLEGDFGTQLARERDLVSRKVFGCTMSGHLLLVTFIWA